MEYRKLGLTDLRVSRVGFGCWAIGGHGYGAVDDDQSIRAIRKALDMGINFFDTADVYGFGHSEEILSRGLGNQRRKAIVATKFGVAWDTNGRTQKDCSPKRIVNALEDSLRRLRLDSVPLYQVHWYDNKTPLEDIMEALKDIQRTGKILHIGASNFPFELASKANAMARTESNQLPYGLAERDFEGDIRKCSEHLRQSVVAFNVLRRGLLSGKYREDATFGCDDTRGRDPNFTGPRLKANLQLVDRLGEIGAIYGKTNSQVAIRWVLDNPHVTSAIVGMKTATQVEENMSALGWSLKKEDGKMMAAW